MLSRCESLEPPMSQLAQNRLSDECVGESASPQRTDINRRDFRGRSVPAAVILCSADGFEGHNMLLGACSAGSKYGSHASTDTLRFGSASGPHRSRALNRTV